MTPAVFEPASRGGALERICASSAPWILGSLLALASGMLPGSCRAFAVYVFEPDGMGGGDLVPGAFSGGNALKWDDEDVDITLAFTPDPPAPLTNGTTTWNENALDAMLDWNDVDANIALHGIVGAGSPCVTDGNVVAAFHPTLCMGTVPVVALGVTRITAVISSPTQLRMVDADVAVIPPGAFTAGGATIQDAYSGPIAFPIMDFRRIVLHEFGHVIGLAHPDEVFGVSPFTRETVMFSASEQETLSEDDKNGVLALYGVHLDLDGDGGGDGDGSGGSAGGWLAIVLGIFAASKFVRGRWRAWRART